MKQKTNKLVQFKQWILSFVVGRYVYHFFSLVIALLIAIATWIPRLILKIFRVKTDVYKFLDTYFPLMD